MAMRVCHKSAASKVANRGVRPVSKVTVRPRGEIPAGAAGSGGSSVAQLPVMLSPDQHTDDEHIENVGADSDGERGRIMSEMIIEQAGEPAAGAMPPPLNSNSVGILQEASDAGNNSRTARI